jgi:hypothetical protein
MNSPADYIEAAATRALGIYAASATPGTYLHGSAVQASVDANDVPLPLINLFDYTTNQQTTTSRVERADCTMYFGDRKDGQGDDAIIEAAAVERMHQLRRRFLAALDNSPVVEITNMRATPFHDAYGAKLTGVGMQFTLGVPAGSLVEACQVFPAPTVLPLATEKGNLLLVE